MNITKIATAATFAAVLVLTGCSNGSTPETTPATPTATSPAPVETVTPTEAPTPDVIIPTEAPAPVAGDAIPADKVEELRESGVSVYVSPNAGGEGLVVEPGVALPEIVVNDIAANSIPAAPANKSEFAAQTAKVKAQIDEMRAADLSVLYITYTGDYAVSGELTGSGYVVTSMNVDNARAFFSSAGRTDAPTKEGALAKVQPLIDSNPGIMVIDLTN